MAASETKKKRSSADSSNRARLLNRIIFGLALWGTLLTVHLWIQSERGFSRGCFGLSEPEEVGIVECAAVVQSDAGKLFGISNIVYGFFFFGTIAALSFATILVKDKKADQLKTASFGAVAIGVAYALYLFFYQVFILGTFCKLCLTTGLTTVTIFGVFLLYRMKKTPSFDLAGLVREVGWFLLISLTAGLLLVGDVFFVNRIGTLEDHTSDASTVVEEPVSESVAPEPLSPEDSLALANELAALCRYDETVPPLDNFDRMVAGTPTVGDPGAPVRILEFFDPNCPHCKTLHSLMPQILASLGDKAVLHYRPFALWPYSYPQVEALYLADEEDKFDAMMQLQMDRQKPGGMSVSELADIAGDIGMDADQFRRDMNNGKQRSRVNREKALVSRAGINSVPKVAIEGRFVSGRAINPSCMEYLVDQVAAG